MVLAVTVYAALLAFDPDGPAPHWLQDLLASPTAKSVATRQVAVTGTGGAPAAETSKSGGGAKWHANSTNDVALFAEFKTADAERVKAGCLARACKFEDAYQSMAAFRRERPDLCEFVDDQAADLANLTGRYSEAYTLVLPFTRSKGAVPAHYLLTLSVASAGLGQVYAGQAEYCRAEAIEGCFQDRFIAEGLDRRHARADPQGVVIYSCLALGFKYGETPYLEMALRLDPANVLAARGLTFFYQVQRRTADVQRIASGMLSALPAGDPRRGEFVKQLDAAGQSQGGKP
jgi:hypothetical protein